MYSKLEIRVDGKWVPHSFTPIFKLDTSNAGTKRVLAGVPNGDINVMRSLLDCIEPPYFALYVLHTSRGEGEEGRYQSPLLTRRQVESFLTRFADYFAGDSRFDLWVHSPSTNGTIVWDRHNLLFGYGPIACYEETLVKKMGFGHGNPSVDFRHMHYYRDVFDEDAKAVLGAHDWHLTPLKEEDVQFRSDSAEVVPEDELPPELRE